MPFKIIKNLAEKYPLPGCLLRVIHAQSMTSAYWEIDAGSIIPDHSHPHEQIMNLIEGEFELSIGGESRHMKPGMVAVIPSNVAHSGRAITACRVIDVFHPVREDLK
jgi:quercetin dioxygenase-like cupin family protein